MPQSQPPEPEFLARHTHLVRDYASRHFTDPEIALVDAAIYWDLNERTLRKSLEARGTSWKTILLDLRMERAAETLAATTYKIEDVARLSGYRSPSAFAKAFQERFRATPREYRRGKGGPARAGGPTGAFFKPAQRARGERADRSAGISAGDKAVQACEIAEAGERLEDQRLLEAADPRVTLDEITDAWVNPRRMRDDPAYWRQRRRDFDAWVGENNRDDAPAARQDPDADSWPVIER